MHYHCEIVIPPTDDVESSVKAVMSKFDENGNDPSDLRYSFWDWWVIGGRWAGEKLLATFDRDRMAAFHQALSERKVTVSGVTAGKQSLEPQSQIPIVDSLWHEFFPNAPAGPCPLFAHCHDQYSKTSDFLGDVCQLIQAPVGLTCSRVVVGGPKWDGPELEPHFMISESIYNGCNRVESSWDGKFSTALEMVRKTFDGYRDDWKEKITPKPNWLVVTVDYHS